MLDTITEEIRTIRRALAADCGNDIDRIFASLRKTAESSGRNYVSMPMRSISRQAKTEQTIAPEHATGRFGNG